MQKFEDVGRVVVQITRMMRLARRATEAGRTLSGGLISLSEVKAESHKAVADELSPTPCLLIHSQTMNS